MDVLLVVVAQVALDGGRVVRGVENLNVFGGEQRSERLGPATLDIDHHPVRADADRVELLLGAQTVRGDRLDVVPELPKQRRDAHHEEFIQIAGDDGKELHPLDQRMARVLSLQQNPLVEFQPAQLAVDVEGRILQIRRLRPGAGGRAGLSRGGVRRVVHRG